jgi:hypothetical protein
LKFLIRCEQIAALKSKGIPTLYTDEKHINLAHLDDITRHHDAIYAALQLIEHLTFANVTGKVEVYQRDNNGDEKITNCYEYKCHTFVE